MSASASPVAAPLPDDCPSHGRVCLRRLRRRPHVVVNDVHAQLNATRVRGDRRAADRRRASACDSSRRRCRHPDLDRRRPALDGRPAVWRGHAAHRHPRARTRRRLRSGARARRRSRAASSGRRSSARSSSSSEAGGSRGASSRSRLAPIVSPSPARSPATRTAAGWRSVRSCNRSSRSISWITPAPSGRAHGRSTRSLSAGDRRLWAVRRDHTRHAAAAAARQGPARRRDRAHERSHRSVRSPDRARATSTAISSSRSTPTMTTSCGAGCSRATRRFRTSTPLTESPVRFSPDEWSRLTLLAHCDKRRAFEVYAAGTCRRPGQVYWSDAPALFAVPRRLPRATSMARWTRAVKGSEMITELYVPRPAAGELHGRRARRCYASAART